MRPALVLLLALLAGRSAEVPSERRIAVTVDDLPVNGPDNGIAVLRAMNDTLVAKLVANRVPAVGFVNEAKLYRDGEVDARIALLRRWVDADLELGNHTFSHPDLNKVGVAAYQEEVVRGETVTRQLLDAKGRKLRWFRHCFLRTGKTAEDKAAFEAFLKGRGYAVAPVTVENDDWYFNAGYAKAKARGDRETMARIAGDYLAHWTTLLDYYEKLSRDLFGREIAQTLLMHENELNADHFDAVAALLRARGYRFVPLAEALADPAYAHADTYIGGWGKSWLQRWWVSEGRPKRFEEEPEPPAYVGKLYETAKAP